MAPFACTATLTIDSGAARGLPRPVGTSTAVTAGPQWRRSTRADIHFSFGLVRGPNLGADLRRRVVVQLGAQNAPAAICGSARPPNAEFVGEADKVGVPHSADDITLAIGFRRAFDGVELVLSNSGSSSTFGVGVTLAFGFCMPGARDTLRAIREKSVRRRLSSPYWALRASALAGASLFARSAGAPIGAVIWADTAGDDLSCVRDDRRHDRAPLPAAVVAIVEGFGCRPIATTRRTPGPAPKAFNERNRGKALRA
jgi:hypothetical protein